MPGRPTIRDVARAACLGTATVDRVLNGRGAVREETARKVAEAARQVGYPRLGPLSAAPPTVPEVRLGFVLLKEQQEFYQNFRREIEAAAAARADVRVRVHVRFCPSQAPDDLAREIAAAAEHAQAVAATAVSHPALTGQVQALKERGLPVFALLNDFAQGVRQNYLGVNNLKVGRIAGWMMATAVRDPGRLALFVGSSRWHGHVLRETGFRSYLRERGPQFTVLDTLVNLETRKLTYEATLDLIDRHADLRGIYVAGGGMEGAIQALREARPPGRIALVVNEATAVSRAALTDGYVTLAIATPLAELCRATLEVMVRAVLEGPEPTMGQHFVEPQLHVPESV
ncbi:LacI family transcriptional regulator [Wenxinia marina]|uniref:LacI family DNA-binding transcriptional regulator n=1 Tax=Wenxinia marina TaxID=390641 RepID=UPI00037CA2C1|nr:LacI family DNA-binding transcriptional regulator [Wenxinia marina]GGL49951.1 LacI family transcriptional regulator [Wenxinia marina]